ncbi:MAG: hypothetical protein CMO55_13030 [Verrucomicrobiales bacterium]|nr:hypothetical protein [Verrucomicrobiales bacterium]
MSDNAGKNIPAFHRFLRQGFEIPRLDFSSLRKPAVPQTNQNLAGDIERVVARLTSIVNDYCSCAQRVGCPLDAEAIQIVLLALHTESVGGDYRIYLKAFDPTATFLRTSLFNELLEVAGCEFIAGLSRTEGSSHTQMDSACWRICLTELERRLGIC